jgi:hypothetical protein
MYFGGHSFIFFFILVITNTYTLNITRKKGNKYLCKCFCWLMPSKLGVLKISSITPMFIKIRDQIKNEDEKDTQDKNKGVNSFLHLD